MDPDENVAIQSEISMSIVTDHWRSVQQPRSRSMLRWPWRRSPSPIPHYRPIDEDGIPRRTTAPEANEFKWQKHINPEPVILLSCTAFGLFVTIYPLFLFWARCVEMFDTYNWKENNSTNASAYCQTIAQQKDHHALDLVEEDVAQKSIYLQICSTLPAVFTAPIFGAWSDYHGRRLPFFLCQLGSFFYFSVFTVNSLLYTDINVYVFMAPAEFVFGLFSGIMVFTMASTIIIDESRQKLAESRSGIPLRIAAASAIQFLGLFLGNSLSSVLLNIFTGADHPKGYTVAFAIATVLSGLALVYTMFWVRETHFPAETGDDQLSFATHLRHYTLDAFGVLLKKREGWIRLCLFLTVLFMFIDTRKSRELSMVMNLGK